MLGRLQDGVSHRCGASPLRVEWYAELADGVAVERLWELMNVKYVITWRGTLLPASDVLHQEPTIEDTTYLHRLEHYLPRAYVVHRAEVLRGDEALERLADGDFDPAETVILDQKPGLLLAGDTNPADSTVSVVEYEPTRMVLEVETPANGILVLSEIYYPGWKAYVDGQERKIYRANHALRAVELEVGYHRVELAYEPLSVKLGSAVSLMSLILVLCLAVWSKVSRVREPLHLLAAATLTGPQSTCVNRGEGVSC